MGQAATVTTQGAVLVTPPRLQDTFVTPVVKPVTKPSDDTDAFAGTEVIQLTVPDTSPVVASVYVAVATTFLIYAPAKDSARVSGVSAIEATPGWPPVEIGRAHV